MSATPEAALICGYKIARESVSKLGEDLFEEYEEYFFDTDPWAEKGDYIFGIIIEKVSDGNPCEKVFVPEGHLKVYEMTEIFCKLFGKYEIPNDYLVFRWN